MCGIAGILNPDGRPVARAVLASMADAVAHRGPDGQGVWADAGLGMAHRRLAIIDVSPAGSQPMVVDGGRFALVYNGEVYNYRELRSELQSEGYAFHSRSDTEVVLRALAHWGPQAVERFNGMFALAFWDGRKRTLTLARDRYGIKPLYYAMAGGSLVFGSEVKALLRAPGLRADVDREGLIEYFTFQNFFSDRTLFDGVKMFPAGCRATVRADAADLAPRIERYWDFRFEAPDNVRDEREYEEELRRLMRQAVERQMVADVELGAYLSGGLDSGAIVHFASSFTKYMKTFTLGFDLSSASGLEMSFDERPGAERMSYLYRTEHYEMVLKAGDMERCMNEYAWHLEEPRVGQSYPNYYVAKLAGKFVKVVLSGTGGDELFCGYPWRYFRAAQAMSFDEFVDAYYLYWQRLIPNRQIHNVFSPIWKDVSHVWTRDIFADAFGSRAEALKRPEDFVNQCLYLEARTFLHGLLVVEDKLSMAHGLEARVPFLDNDLVDFAQKLPVSLKLGRMDGIARINENEPGSKVRKYYQRHKNGKRIMRNGLKGLVPDEVCCGDKQGFSAPDASWFKGESIDFVREAVLSPGARIYDYMDRKAVGALVEEHLSGTVNRRLFVWSLLNFEWWLKSFVA